MQGHDRHGQLSSGVFAQLAGRRPTSHIAEQLGQSPAGFETELRRWNVRKRERQPTVTLLDQLALRRPVGTDRLGIESAQPPERKLVEDGYRGLPFPFADIPTPEFSLEARWVLPQLLGYMRSWSATGAYVQQHGVDPVAVEEAALTTLWGDPERERRIRWPMGLRIGRKP